MKPDALMMTLYGVPWETLKQRPIWALTHHCADMMPWGCGSGWRGRQIAAHYYMRYTMTVFSKWWSEL